MERYRGTQLTSKDRAAVIATREGRKEVTRGLWSWHGHRRSSDLSQAIFSLFTLPLLSSPSFDPIKIKIYLRCLATHAYDLTLSLFPFAESRPCFRTTFSHLSLCLSSVHPMSSS